MPKAHTPAKGHPWKSKAPKRRKPKPAELEHMYHEQKLNQRQIAELVGYSYATVRKWFDEYGIERRREGWADPNGRLAKQRRKANRPYMRLTPEARAIVDDQVATLIALARSRRLARELKADLEVDYV